MDKFLNDNISYQKQDEIFFDGIGKMVQANLYSYMAGQRREQQRDDRQRSEIQEVLDIVKALIEKQDMQQSEIKAISQNIQSGFQSLQQQSNQQSEEWEGKAKEIQKDTANVFNEIQKIRSNMDAQTEEQEKFKNVQERLKEENSQLKQKIEEFREIIDEWNVYYQFKDWQPVLQSPLQFPKRDGFINFIASCSHEKAIETFFQILGGSIWGLQEQDIKMFDQLIDFCINLQNRFYGRELYSRMHVEIGESYSLTSHQSYSDDPAVGMIAQVLLRGINKNGHIIHKSFVRVKERGIVTGGMQL